MSERGPIDEGLAEAFGDAPASRVLRALQARCDSVLGVHLDPPDDTPVHVTDDAKALRDPSGRYQVLGEIGRGGVGVVYEGRDQDLGRDVAMKVLKDEYADHPDVLARFVEEAQIGGQPAPEPGGTARLRELAARLDPEDAWRLRLRELLPDSEHRGEELKALAEEASFSELSAAGCRLLAVALWHAGEQEAAITALERGAEVYPRDFDLCFLLALFLEQLDVPRWDEAAATYRIAEALRPAHREVLHRLGLALERLARYAEAERTFRRLSALEPSSPHWLRHIGIELNRQGRSLEAMDIYERRSRSSRGMARSTATSAMPCARRDDSRSRSRATSVPSGSTRRIHASSTTWGSRSPRSAGSTTPSRATRSRSRSSPATPACTRTWAARCSSSAGTRTRSRASVER